MVKVALPFLNRYTSLPAVIDMLTRKRITLLSPTSWEDANDAYYIERYRGEMHMRTVLALCFSERRETFHQWKVFANGVSGVCVEFSKRRLLMAIEGKRGFRSKHVDYLYISQNTKPELSNWPFLKRRQFEDEDEFRIIYESATESLRYKAVKIDLRVIQKITLSPWLPECMTDSVVHTLKSIDGCENMAVARSTLLDNADWRKAID